MQQAEEITSGAAQAVADVASKVTYSGSGASLLGWLTNSNTATLVGMAVAILGFVVNWWFKRQHDALERREDARRQEEHDAMMKKLLG